MNILDIPFLELDIDIDLDKLKAEVDIVSNKYGYESYKSNYLLARRKYKKAWSGVSLYSTNGSLYDDFEEGPYYNDIQPTELEDIVPYMFSIINKIYGDSPKSKVRLMRISPKTSLLWHSHVQEHNQATKDLVIQIPIYLPKGFKYCVVHKDEFKWWKRLHKPSWFKTLAESNFKEGRAFYFNSYHYHNVYNPTDEYRATIMFYVDVTHPHIEKMFLKCLKK